MFKGDATICAIEKVIILHIETYKTVCFLVADIFNNVVKIINVKNISITVLGMSIIFIKVSLGVVSAVHILFNNSIVFNNLHKFIFKFRTNATSTIIC